MANTEIKQHRVLVLAPTGRDAALISDALTTSGVSVAPCSDAGGFRQEFGKGAAAGLVAEEALDAAAVPVLIEALREQPAWSDFPLILMISRHGVPEQVSALVGDSFNITLIERPVRIQTLSSSVQSALRQRRRQYELRDHLADQQQTEERLRQTQKLESLGVLAGGVAHDFNNLLTGIIGNTSLALDHLDSDNPARAFLEHALQASQRTADLTRQLLAYSGKGRFLIEPIDLSGLVQEIATLIRTSISKKVTLELELAAGLPCVVGDATQIQQVVMNLVINAAEAIDRDQSGVVHVTTGVQQVSASYIGAALFADHVPPGEYVYMEVRDNGCGVDQASLMKIFDPFYTTKFMGRGLGLAAVQGIVRGHKGMLYVDSIPGDGSTFRVLFPAAKVEPVRSEPEPGPRDLRGSGTILVVDDEEIVRKIARNALESYGYRVVLAENGQIALDLFARMADRISAVLLDMTMPVMGGEETVRNLRRIRPDVKVVLTSGYNEADAIRRFTGAGLAGFLQKPFTAGRLAAKLKALSEG